MGDTAGPAICRSRIRGLCPRRLPRWKTDDGVVDHMSRGAGPRTEPACARGPISWLAYNAARTGTHQRLEQRKPDAVTTEQLELKHQQQTQQSSRLRCARSLLDVREIVRMDSERKLDDQRRFRCS